jgi:hypothetical protein
MLALLAEPQRRRGLAGQRPGLLAQRMARRSAVTIVRWMRRRGHGLDDAARKLGLCPTTLGTWCEQWRTDRFELHARGRRPYHGDRELRRQILAVFGLMGLHVALPTLRNLFPQCPVNELSELMERCRSQARRKGAVTAYALHWHVPGAVWAIDGTKPPAPVDGQYPVILAVRDLASGEDLAATPAPAEDGDSLGAVLEALFIEHGPPLVLKSDNGACRSETVEKLLSEWHVLHLTSPPVTPRYNGSIEAGIGGIKTEAHWEAARHDHPGEWTSDDLEAARRKANETHRPWGALQPTPDEAWSRRAPLESDARFDLMWHVWGYREQERLARGCLPGIAASRSEEAAIKRTAISRALLKLGYLTIRRRRFTPLISKRFVTNIS